MTELDLPYVDEHAVDVRDSREVAWAALEQYATGLGFGRHNAKSYAEFPGLHGRIYRALVIGTHGHAVVTQQMVRTIRSRAAALATEQDS